MKTCQKIWTKCQYSSLNRDFQSIWADALLHLKNGKVHMCCPIVPPSESSDIRKRKTDYMRDQRSSQLLQHTLNLFATLRSIIVWECMWFLIRDNVHQWVCFLYRSLAASVGFVTMVAEETVSCCVACGHVLQQLPSSFLSRSAGMSQHWPSFPAPPLPSEGAHQHQVGCFCPPLSHCTCTVVGAPKVWLAAAAAVQVQRQPWASDAPAVRCPAAVWWGSSSPWLPAQYQAASDNSNIPLSLGAVYCPGDRQRVSPLR